MRTLFVTTAGILGLGVVTAPVSAQSGATVRLEAHNGQTQFRLGDPVIVDLVFTGGSASDAVMTSPTWFLPGPDAVALQPLDGWLRTHDAAFYIPPSGTQTPFAGAPIRVPILINHTVTFLYPTHYELTVVTTRLLTQTPAGYRPGECYPCETNSLGIDILPERVPQDEAALVAKLSGRIGELNHEQVNADPVHRHDLEAERSNDAQRIAYLIGDDAIRAKVHLIAEDPDTSSVSDAAAITRMMMEGLCSSWNKQLQLDLLEDAWQDPSRVPTSALQRALRQAKQLMHSSMPTPDNLLWIGDNDERQAALAENRREIDEIEATLDLRTPENRAATLSWLKDQAAPNQFNNRQLPPTGQ